MVKQTHKFKALRGDVDAVLSAAPNLSEAARTLGVDRSTLTRWLASGKVKRPAKGGPRRVTAAALEATADTGAVPTTSTAWAAGIRAAYALTATESELVGLADAALQLAQDLTVKPEIRLTAMTKFQALVRQLNFEESEANGETQTTGSHSSFPRAV